MQTSLRSNVYTCNTFENKKKVTDKLAIWRDKNCTTF